MRRRGRRLLVAAAVVLPLGLLLTLVPFLWPRMDRPTSADAVVILSGDHGERLPIALRLMERDVAPTLVFDGTIDRAIEDRLCAERGEYEVLCLRPQPDSTRHEARAAGRLAKERRWKKVIVVTSTYHIPRSRLLFNRCVDGDVLVVGGRPPYGARLAARQIVHEWLGTVHALTIRRGC